MSDVLLQPRATVPTTGPTAAELRHGIIHTQVSRPVAWGMTVLFVMVLLAVPMVQRPPAFPWSAAVPSRDELKRYEDGVRDQSIIANAVQPRVQMVLAQLGAGSSTVVIGSDQWLFYRPGIDAITGPGVLEPLAVRRRTRAWRDVTQRETVHPDPRPAIVQFHRQLRERGIQLVVVPIPDKASVQFHQIGSGSVRLPRNASFARLVEDLRAEGVEVFDPAPGSVGPGDALFLRHDTHWTPQWMEQVAGQLAGRLDRHAPRHSVEVREVSDTGDLVRMMRLPLEQRLFAPQTVAIQRVLDSSGAGLGPDRSSSVLLLGDSFSNIYSAPQMGWGSSAGFAEHLSLHLGETIDWIASNDNGAFATRQILAGELARDPKRLAGKKVVIWQFAERELALGDWRPIELGALAAAPGSFVVPPPGEQWVITGRISSKGPSPRPQRVAYRDHILAVHLTDVRIEGKAGANHQAMVYLRSMIDLQLTPAASLQAGQTIRCRVRDWSAVARQYQLITRSDVADPQLRLEPACWGELVVR